MSKWIKTSDRLPEVGKKVLGYGETHGYAIYILHEPDACFRVSGWLTERVSPPLYWMEIPPLPGEHSGIYRAEVPAEVMSKPGTVVVDPEDFPFIEVK